MTEPLARILAVDDKPENLRLLEAILVPSGYEVVTASSGDEALAKVRDTKPDMVLTDIVMPGMNGYELCRRLRADPATSDIALLAFSASIDSSEALRSVDDGGWFDGFVMKPIPPSELAQRIGSCIETRRLLRAATATA